MGKILRFVQDIKLDLGKKKELEIARNVALQRLDDGVAFFKGEGVSPEHGVNTTAQTKHLQVASAEFSGFAQTLLGIESDIRDIDISVVIKLETFFTDFVIKFETSARIDQTGDKLAKEIMVLVPYYSDNPEYTEITPEDLKVVLFLKDKFQIRNFKVTEQISKETYYSNK